MKARHLHLRVNVTNTETPRRQGSSRSHAGVSAKQPGHQHYKQSRLAKHKQLGDTNNRERSRQLPASASQTRPGSAKTGAPPLFSSGNERSLSLIDPRDADRPTESSVVQSIVKTLISLNEAHSFAHRCGLLSPILNYVGKKRKATSTQRVGANRSKDQPGAK